MKKLKTLLSFPNLVLLLIFLLTIVILKTTYQKPCYQEKRLGSKEIIGIIKNIEIGENATRLTANDTLISVKDDTFELGEKVVCKGEVSLPMGRRNFYLFDYQKYLASMGIYYIMKGECTVVSSPSILYSIKNEIIKRIQKLKSYPYLNAFLLGNNKNIKENVRKSYQENGISHLFAVSGMHIGFFFLLFEKMFKKERWRNFFLFLFFLFFLFLTNFSPSVMRASLFFFFSKWLRKLDFSIIQSFLLFTMVMLIYQPYFLYHTGFLYSFTISFFLILFSTYIKEEKNAFKRLLKISFIAMFASFPIQIETNFSMNVLSILYNIFFVPLVSSIIFPFSFLVFLFPVLDSFYFFLLTILENISLFLLKIPSLIIFSHMSPFFIFCYYSIFLFVMNKIIKKEYIYTVVLLFFLLFHFFLPRLNSKGIILMMDVGQGDSTLIIYPYQKLTILIDTGGAHYDTKIAQNIIIPTLHAHGITSLDYLIFSHGDLDHVGEALSLLEKVRVKKVFFNSGSDTEMEQKIIQLLKKKQISYEKVSKKKLDSRENVIQFLNSKNSENENEDSLVNYFKIQNYSILFMGDSGIETEKELLQEYNLSSMDILKVGHHGSKYSTSGEFISKITPKVCLISVGEGNRYGHPHLETLQQLKLCNTYLTSIDGAIKIELGKSMHVTTVR